MIGKKDLLKLTRSVQEFEELLNHMDKNQDQLEELKQRLEESHEKRETVAKAIEDIHTMFAAIKEKQTLIVSLNRELASVEHAVSDRVKIIADETKAVLEKMAEEFNS